MRHSIIRCFLLFIFVSVTSVAFTQNVLKGVVIDEFEKNPLPFAKIYVECIQKTILASEEGEFSIEIPIDSCEVEFSFSSYTSLKRIIIFTPENRTITQNFTLAPKDKILATAVISTSKYETNPEKSTTSILVLSPKTAEDRGLTTADQLLNTAGGVAVVNNEPQIRGGSGFSSGMGSRVLILLDDMPMLRPDAGRPMWNFIPMEDVEQIDILKGAASVVFGSSALTGAINVHTAYPRSKPKTKIILFGGIYNSPNPSGEERYQQSWDRTPVKYGINFLHSRIIKKNFDFVIGGELFGDQGYIGPETTVDEGRNTNVSTIGQYEKRARLNFATRYRFQKVRGLSVSLNGNFMYSKNAQSFFWYDCYRNRYRTYEGSLSHFEDKTFYIDPVITYMGKNDLVLVFRNRILKSWNGEASGSQDAESLSVFDEFQVNKTFRRIGTKIVGGVMNNYATSVGRAFSGDNYSDEAVKMYSNNLAIYAQLEQQFLKKRNLIIHVGGRWEFYDLEGETENKPIFRAGANYQLDNIKTSFRASFGQGYRYPSIGEKFIAISVGKYGFYPNPDLISEKSWNAEIGVMQPFKVFDFLGVADIAFFNQRYDNYIEFAMGLWGKAGQKVTESMGFKYLNIGPARIRGIDFSVMGEGKISKNVTYTLAISYTFSNPVSLDPNHVYYTDANKKNYTFNNSSSDSSRNVLKYRIEHMTKFDLTFTFFKKFSAGISANYYGAMKNVDNFFFDFDIDNPNLEDFQRSIFTEYGDLPFKGYYEYYNSKDNQRGSLVFDARISYIIKDITLSFIAKNLFNKSYTLRPMYVEPPRTLTLQLVYNI